MRIIGLLFLVTCQAFTQQADTSAQKAASYFREADSAAWYQQLWNQHLYGPMLLVDPRSRHTYAYRPDSAGNFKQALPGVYEGIADCGHYIPEEQPEKFLELVIPFLTAINQDQ